MIQVNHRSWRRRARSAMSNSTLVTLPLLLACSTDGRACLDVEDTATTCPTQAEAADGNLLINTCGYEIVEVASSGTLQEGCAGEGFAETCDTGGAVTSRMCCYDVLMEKVQSCYY